MDLLELKAEGRKLQEEYRVSWQTIETLRANCRHPKIKYEPHQTICEDCKTILWSAKQYRLHSHIVVAPEDLADIPGAVVRWSEIADEANAKLRQFQAECLHPEGEKEPQHEPTEFECGVCGLDWGRVIDQRRARNSAWHNN